ELAAAVELLDAVVPSVGNVDIAGLVNRDATAGFAGVVLADGVELAVAGALGAEGGDEVTLAVELLDAEVGRVHHEHVARIVHGDAARQVELALVGSGYAQRVFPTLRGRAGVFGLLGRRGRGCGRDGARHADLGCQVFAHVEGEVGRAERQA